MGVALSIVAWVLLTTGRLYEARAGCTSVALPLGAVGAVLINLGSVRWAGVWRIVVALASCALMALALLLGLSNLYFWNGS